MGRKLGGMGMDLDGDTVVWHIDLDRKPLVSTSNFRLNVLLRKQKHLLFGMRLEDSPSGVGWGK